MKKIFFICCLLSLPALLWAQGEVDSMAPDFTLDDSEGNTHSLSDYQDKVLFIFVMGYS